MFTDELGERLHPEYVPRRFREPAEAAGLPARAGQLAKAIHVLQAHESAG